jgi:YVTN family beta-propeller protein
MSIQKLLVAAVAFAFVGCSSSGPARSSGSLAVSNDQQYIYAVDTDSNAVFVMDARSLDVVTSVKVGNRPYRVVVGTDDTLYVANRGSRTVSVIHKGDWKEASTLATGIDPNGMQVSADGKTLYVVSSVALDSADHGVLQAFDTATLQNSWTMAVGKEPRGLALVAGGRAVVSLYREGDVQTVDLASQKVVQASTDVFSQANKSSIANLTTMGPTAPNPSNPVTYSPRALADLAASPSGDRVYAPGQLSRNSPIVIPPTPSVPYYESQGPANAGSVTTPAVFTFGVQNGGLDTSRIEDVVAARQYSQCASYTGAYGGGAYSGCGPAPLNTDAPQTGYAVAGFSGEATLQGPSVAVVDMTGAWLFMVNRESQNLSIISTTTRTARPDNTTNSTPSPYGGYGSYANETPSVHSTTNGKDIGAGADGIAILGDNQTAFVYAQFDHKLTRVQLDARSEQLNVTGSQTTTNDTALGLDPAVVAGRKLFHDAINPSVSAPTAAVACSSCHLEGLDDGQTWEFNDGPRNTPVLAGRGITQTAPFHWSGEFSDMNAFFTNVVTARMGGTGLLDSEAQQIEKYMDALPVPENPYVGSALTAQQQHGAQLFQTAGCAQCHSGQFLTDNKIQKVGTFNNAMTNPDNGPFAEAGFNTPSLKGLFRSGPYLHDGSDVTLMDRVNDDRGGQHGVTSNLTNQDKADLVEYLKTL